MMQANLTPEQIDGLSGVELDKAIHAACGQCGESYWMASSDDGKSSCASTLERALWRSESSLREWLEGEQAKGYFRDYKIVRGVRYHPYHTDQGAALGLLKDLNQYVRIDLGQRAITVRLFDRKGTVIATGPKDQAAETLCRAYLKLTYSSKVR